MRNKRARTFSWILSMILLGASASHIYSGDSLLPALREDGIVTEKGLRVMVEAMGVALKKEVNIPSSRLVDYSLLNKVQRELGPSEETR